MECGGVLTLGDYALHTDQVAKVTSSNGAWGDVLSSKASLEPDMEFFILLSIGVIKSQHILPHCTPEGKNFQLGFIQESGGSKHQVQRGQNGW